MMKEEIMMFVNLDGALEKGELVGEKSIIPRTYEKLGEHTHVIKHDLKVYRFGGIKIGREEYGFYEAVSGLPEEPVPCHPPGFSKENAWTRYYVYDGDELVSDGNEAMGLIKKATGVELSTLESWDSTINVVTEIDLEEDLDFKARLECQPYDSEIGLQAYNMKRQLESSPKEFNLGDLGYDLSHNKEIIELIDILARNLMPRKA